MDLTDILWLILIVVLALGAILTFWPRKHFACSRCSAITTLGAMGMPDRCAACGTYHIKKAGRIRPVGPGDILGGCDLAVLYDAGPEPLKPDPSEWVWPDRCCICGGKPQRYDDLTVGMATGSALAGLAKEITKWTFKVPYRAAHRDGARWGSDLSTNVSDPPLRMALQFSSYDYWLLFKELNCLRRPEAARGAASAKGEPLHGVRSSP